MKKRRILYCLCGCGRRLSPQSKTGYRRQCRHKNPRRIAAIAKAKAKRSQRDSESPE